LFIIRYNATRKKKVAIILKKSDFFRKNYIILIYSGKYRVVEEPDGGHLPPNTGMHIL